MIEKSIQMISLPIWSWNKALLHHVTQCLLEGGPWITVIRTTWTALKKKSSPGARNIQSLEVSKMTELMSSEYENTDTGRLSPISLILHEENNLSQMYLTETLKSTCDTSVTDIPFNNLGYNITQLYYSIYTIYQVYTVWMCVCVCLCVCI